MTTTAPPRKEKLRRARVFGDYGIVGEYVAYFNHARPHQGIGQRLPDPRVDDGYTEGRGPQRGVGHPVLGGLHHDYRWVA